MTILKLKCIEVRCKNPTILYNTGKFTGKCRLVHVQKKTKLGLLRLINYPFKISVNDTLYYHKPPFGDFVPFEETVCGMWDKK